MTIEAMGTGCRGSRFFEVDHSTLCVSMSTMMPVPAQNSSIPGRNLSGDRRSAVPKSSGLPKFGLALGLRSLAALGTAAGAAAFE